ncbi:AAA family ATPase [Bosea sp. TND4EK4]|uniref:AAA family ATPase n=1 Tax=Bosea sp. TND4EK4 TaxID=1907408 RepID=UPI0015896828|nr:AAA family ATPase [Bosea sp. TND4EK4]
MNDEIFDSAYADADKTALRPHLNGSRGPGEGDGVPAPGPSIEAEPPHHVAIFDPGALLIQLERCYGRAYQFEAETELGLPQPNLSTEEQVRLDKLRWLADDERGPARPLLFGSQATRDRLAKARLACPGFAVVIDLVDRCVALSMLSGAALSVPPILMLGPPGIGKTHASKAIAKALGVASHAFSCATNSDAQQLVVGHPTSWRGSRMSVVNEALVGGDTAQPVIILDEIDKFQTHRDEQPYHVLLNLFEPENSRALEDEYLRIPFNLSYTIVVATANDASRLPDYILDRLAVFEIAPPSGDELLAITRLIVAAALAEARGAIVPPGDDVLARLARANPRRITRIVRLALGYAAAAGRDHLNLADVEAADRLTAGAAKPEAIGFLGAGRDG